MRSVVLRKALSSRTKCSGVEFTALRCQENSSRTLIILAELLSTLFTGRVFFEYVKVNVGDARVSMAP